MNTNFSATIKVNDVVPGCCSMNIAEEVKHNILANITKKQFLVNSFNTLFGSKYYYNGSHFCYNIYVMKDGEIKLYLNEWSRDTPDQWGSRLYELLISFKNVFDLNEFPNLEQYINKFNKYNGENSANLTLTQYIEKLKEYENKYAFKKEMENINIEDLF